VNWLGSFWKIPDVYALQHQSLDAYLFLRFLRVCAVICFVSLCLTWSILFPLNATGGGTKTELDILSMANINTEQSSTRNRLYAHALVGWLVYGFVLYMIFRESIFYVNLRQVFLLSPTFAKRISQRTVLFTSVPENYRDEAKIRKLFGDSVKRVWITADTTELEKLVEERDEVAMRLEGAEVKLIKLANAERLKAIKKGASEEQGSPPPGDAESGSVAARWVPKKKRPSHKLGFLGLFGQKVDTIEWCRTELARLIPEVDAAQGNYRTGGCKSIPGVFVEFFNQSDAQAAYQVLTHHQAFQMAPRYIGVAPGEVIWTSLRISWWQKILRRYAVVAFIVVMIIFWAVPVAFVAMISKMEFLQSIVFLSWLKQLPAVSVLAHQILEMAIDDANICMTAYSGTH
jgi:calcium permeable stress-gated cation channel